MLNDKSRSWVCNVQEMTNKGYMYIYVLAVWGTSTREISCQFFLLNVIGVSDNCTFQQKKSKILSSETCNQPKQVDLWNQASSAKASIRQQLMLGSQPGYPHESQKIQIHVNALAAVITLWERQIPHPFGLHSMAFTKHNQHSSPSNDLQGNGSGIGCSEGCIQYSKQRIPHW